MTGPIFHTLPPGSFVVDHDGRRLSVREFYVCGYDGERQRGDLEKLLRTAEKKFPECTILATHRGSGGDDRDGFLESADKITARVGNTFFVSIVSVTAVYPDGHARRFSGPSLLIEDVPAEHVVALPSGRES